MAVLYLKKDRGDFPDTMPIEWIPGGRGAHRQLCVYSAEEHCSQRRGTGESMSFGFKKQEGM